MDDIILLKAKRHGYYLKNKERIKSKSRDYYKAHKEERNRTMHDYYEENKEAVLDKNKEYLLKNKAAIYAYKSKWKRGKQAELRHQVIQMLGGKCIKCRISDERVLQIDHINGGDRQDTKRYKNRISFYRDILKTKDDKNYQVLCANCNWIKRHENKEFDQPETDFGGIKSVSQDKKP